ncbi:prenyltransferase [Sporosarcina sp. FA9]|uniref:prenyltransferase n=1 Tax=Sporosarcina sp. FA9 TaxID=3413030 RepID=UPI003F654C0A
MANSAGTEVYTYRASWLTLVRPMTLTGTISPTIAGSALAANSGTIDVTIFLAFLGAALLVQMAINIFNDYFDFLHGQDIEKWEKTKRRSFSKNPVLSQLPAVAIGMLAVAMVLGVWLASESNYWILVVGAISIVAGIYYSAGKPSLSSLGVGELVAAIFLGFVVTGLAYVVEGGNYSLHVVAIAVPYAIIIATMILVNNIRDMKKDIGFRFTLPIVLGRQKALLLLGILITLPYIWLIVLIVLEVTEWTITIAFLALPLAIQLRWKLREDAPLKDKKVTMKWAAWHHWAFGLLFALGIWLS